LPRNLKDAFVRGRYLEDATANVLESHARPFIREQFVQYEGITGQVDFMLLGGARAIIETKYVKSGKFNRLWFVQAMIYAMGSKINDVTFLYGNDSGLMATRVSFDVGLARAFTRDLVKMKYHKRVSAGELIGYHRGKRPKIDIKAVKTMLQVKLRQGLVVFLYP
jgi:hypothetical protein